MTDREPVDLVADLVGPDRDAIELRVKFELARRIALEMEDRGIEIGAAAALAGIDAGAVAKIEQGRVMDCSVWLLMRLLAALGMDVAIEVVPTGREKGTIYVSEDD